MIAHTYFNAAPFSHWVFDDFMPQQMLIAASNEFDDVPAESWVKYDSPDEHGKRTCNDLDVMGKYCKQAISYMQFLSVVSHASVLSGFDGLQPDKTLRGGGLHETFGGGHLGIHADSEIHPESGLLRRLNLIVFLGTHRGCSWLELWDSLAHVAVARIEPVFNRAVLFACGPRNYHGHPSPVVGETRRSLAVYYYSPARTRAQFIAIPGESFDAEKEEARKQRSL